MTEATVYAAIAVMTAVTLMTRLAGAGLMARLGLSGPRTDRFLAAMSSGVIAAIVATAVAQGGAREAAAVAVAAAAMLGARQATVAMAAGMIFAALWTALAA